MATNTSTARWQGKPVEPKPEDYERLDKIVRKARQARGAIVEFDWRFSSSDIRVLQEVGYEGRTTVGRYKCFDARLLDAINKALDDPNNFYALREPKGTHGVDCAVTCTGNDGMFRVQGHAPFDVVFFYARAGLRTDGPRAKFSDDARLMLASTGALLGWDLRRLDMDARFVPVWNALAGVALDYGQPPVAPDDKAAVDVNVHLQGPFSALDDTESRCLFTHPVAPRKGIYLWTIFVAGEERVWYVGKTARGFGERMGEHIRDYLCGRYRPVNPKALAQGRHELLGAIPRAADWPQSLPPFLRQADSLVPSLLELFRILRFHVAPLHGDSRLFERAEGALGRHYQTHSEQRLRDFLTPGLKVPKRIPGEPPLRFVISSEANIAGLPPEAIG